MKSEKGEALNGDDTTSIRNGHSGGNLKGNVGRDINWLVKSVDDADLGCEEVPVRRLDEYDVNFSDTRNFCLSRWIDIAKTTVERLTTSDLKIAAECKNSQDLGLEIQAKLTESSSHPSVKRQMNKLQQLPQILATFTRQFRNLVAPSEINLELLWGLIYLNLKLSYISPQRLKRTSDLLHKIRRLVEIFSLCLDQCEEPNETRIAAVDFLDPFTIILTDSIIYLHEISSDEAANEAWLVLNEGNNSQLWVMDLTIKHVNDITIHSKVNLDRQIKNMSQRHALTAEPDEPGTFPNKILPFQQNQNFYGRKEELDRIYQCLSPKGDSSYRTYTIYGRRGVGKTEVALQFAYTNPAGFDAIFWIQCETSVAIRQSFNEIAISLELPGANRDGHHEENLIAVKDWLKKTRRRWLLIFDNAENAQILQQYWPMGSSGAILLTSRKYHNFPQHIGRKGDTIKPFDTKQSWELLLQLLGEDWKRMDREGKIAQSEITAAKILLEKLEGLALAIQQAAILIKDSEIGGPTIVKTLEMFKEKIRTLPERLSSARGTAEKALDALWDMSFSCLSRNARTLLGVLAFLSPDQIPIDLFLPENQDILDGPLAFAKQDAKHINEHNRVSLSNVINPSLQFQNAITELVGRALIKQDNRNLSIHRVVQEATNYHDLKDLQSSFDAAARLVWHRFPRREMDESLFTKWGICQAYVSHGVYLSKKFSEHTKSGVLKGSHRFVELLSNCTWYIHELGDYEVSGSVLETAILACEDKDSFLYADLRSTAGSRYYDLNQLTNARKAWDDALRIRQSLLPRTSPGVAAIYNNIGNAELATGNTEDSMEYFDRAIPIWKAGGDTTASHLALTYLCVGRVYMLQGKLDAAMKMTSQADALFVRTIGADKGFMTNVHYAYGNIHYRQKQYAFALRDYEACLKIGLANAPIHPIISATYYSIACVEYMLKNFDNAKYNLNKSLTIAELRSPNRDDGPIARIVWTMAKVLDADIFGKDAEEAGRQRARAAVAQQQLLAIGEGGEIPIPEEEEAGRDTEWDSYDALVPLFYR